MNISSPKSFAEIGNNVCGIFVAIPLISYCIELVVVVAIKAFNYFSNRNEQSESQKSILKFCHSISEKSVTAGLIFAGIYAISHLLKNSQTASKIIDPLATSSGVKWSEEKNEWVITHGTWNDLLKLKPFWKRSF
jgi:hypothetical protein